MSEQQQVTEHHPTKELFIEDHKVTLNGVDLFFRTVGEGPVIFLIPPGWGVASDYFQRSFLSLAENYRLVFVDTRGSGRSGRPADSSRMGTLDMAEDIEAVRVHMGLGKISLLGHSNSGAIALAYAERYSRSGGEACVGVEPGAGVEWRGGYTEDYPKASQRFAL